MNVQLENINVTQRDGRVTHLDRVYIRGSHVRLFIVPDMLRCVTTSRCCEVHYMLTDTQECAYVQITKRERQRCRFSKRKGDCEPSTWHSRWQRLDALRTADRAKATTSLKIITAGHPRDEERVRRLVQAMNMPRGHEGECRGGEVAIKRFHASWVTRLQSKLDATRSSSVANMTIRGVDACPATIT